MSVEVMRCLVRQRAGEDAVKSGKVEDLSLGYYVMLPLEDLTVEQLEAFDSEERPLVPLLQVDGAERKHRWIDGAPPLANLFPEGARVFSAWFKRGWGKARTA